MPQPKLASADAERVRRLRQHLGMSQRELATELDVAVSAVAQWETAARQIPGPARKLLALYEEEFGLREVGAPFVSTSRLARGGSLAGMLATRLFFSHFFASSSSPLAARARTAALERYVETVSRFKGLSMKLAQSVGYLDFLLPGPERELLEQATVTRRPMSAAVVATVFFEELGKTPRQLFRRWEPTPLAAASIGQVHAAELASGEPVAVKVQYPGIAEAITSDLANLRALDRFSSLLFRGQRPDVFYQEIQARFTEECDYRLEAQNLARFAAMFRDRGDLVVPAPIPELSTSRVLTMARSDGAPIDPFVATASQEARDRAGAAIWTFYWDSIFGHGCYNTDPHPGNFRFEADRVAVLDFGRVKVFSPGFVAAWSTLVRAVLEDDRPQIRASLIELELATDVDRFDFEFARQALVLLYEPWIHPGRYHFDVERVRAAERMLFVENRNYAAMSYSADMIFFSQLTLGLNALMARLGARVAARDHILGLLYDRPRA